MRTVVVGGGAAGLTAALAALDRGDEVVLLEASDRLGGRLVAVAVDGVAVDGGAESFAVRGDAVRRLLTRVGLADDVVDPVGTAWVALTDRTLPLPAGGLLGIPGSPLAPDVVAVIGPLGGARAYLDRLLPVVRVGRYETLGPLVRRRMGRAVLERLVAPVVESVYGIDPDEAPVDAIAPGLNRAITETGALSTAVLRLRSAAPPGAAAQGIAGGMHRLPGALAAHLAGRGATVRTSSPVRGLLQTADGHLVVLGGEELAADRVVLAADGTATLDLLAAEAPEVAALPRPAPAVSRAVLLSVDDERLDAAPRGSGVLRATARTDVVATALTHISAKWPWVAAMLPPHRHLVRLAYRGAEAPDDRTVHMDAARLLGVPIGVPRARRDVVWSDSAPALAPETRHLRRALEQHPLPGVSVTGSWVAGTGLASVVAHALASP